MRLLSFLLMTSAAVAQQYVISTIAGGAPPPTPAPAVNVSIGRPTKVATDSKGNVYFTSIHCVFKIDASGVLTRLAGNARPGYSGDGGAAASAQLSGPEGVAVDGSGNVYIADSGNARVRTISPGGVITTVAGGGTSGLGDGGSATAAQLAAPYGVALDGSGGLYIADFGDNRVRKVSSSGVITTVAGGISGYSGDGGPAPSAHLSGPAGVAVDGSGNIFIADSSNYRIRKVASDGIITTVAGNGTYQWGANPGDGGLATSATLAYPMDVAIDGSGNLFIADWQRGSIRKVVPSGIITTVTTANLPSGVAVDGSGNLFIADSAGQHLLCVARPFGIVSVVAGNGGLGDGGPAASALLSGPLWRRRGWPGQRLYCRPV